MSLSALSYIQTHTDTIALEVHMLCKEWFAPETSLLFLCYHQRLAQKKHQLKVKMLPMGHWPLSVSSLSFKPGPLSRPLCFQITTMCQKDGLFWGSKQTHPERWVKKCPLQWLKFSWPFSMRQFLLRASVSAHGSPKFFVSWPQFSFHLVHDGSGADHSMNFWEMKDSWPVEPWDHDVFVAQLVSVNLN